MFIIGMLCDVLYINMGAKDTDDVNIESDGDGVLDKYESHLLLHICKHVKSQLD
jgi:hypothetical protein